MKKLTSFLVIMCALLFAGSVRASTLAPTGPAKVAVGQTFQVAFQIKDAKDVDTIRLNGVYSQDLLDWVGASPAGAFQNISPATSVNKKNGSFSFGAFSLGDTVQGAAKIAVLTFKAKKEGTAFVRLDSTSRVLSAGEDQLETVGELQIKIGPGVPAPVVEGGAPLVLLFSTSHPAEDAWYQSSDIVVTWKIAEKEVKRTYIGFDQLPEGPAEKPVTDSVARFQATSDGIWYVHLLIEFADGSSRREHLRIQIDQTKPMSISPTVDQTNVEPDVQNFLRFGTTDNTSGVVGYEVYVDGSYVTTTLERYLPLEYQRPGIHVATVKALDAAGNSITGATYFNILLPKGTVISPQFDFLRDIRVLFLFLFALCLILFAVTRKREERKKAK